MTTSCRKCGRELPNGYACPWCEATPPAPPAPVVVGGQSSAEVLVAALRQSPAPAERRTEREALDVRRIALAAWDDGVRFAAEMLRSQVFPRSEARSACVDRVLAHVALRQPVSPAPEREKGGA